MIGITSYSAHIPWYRLSRAKMNEATGFLMTFPPPGERSVANQNEDSVTMAAAASIYCLEGEDRDRPRLPLGQRRPRGATADEQHREPSEHGDNGQRGDSPDPSVPPGRSYAGAG